MMDKSYFLKKIFEYYPIGKVDLYESFPGRALYKDILTQKIISVRDNTDQEWDSFKELLGYKFQDFSFQQFPSRIIYLPQHEQLGLYLIYSLLCPYFTMFWEDRDQMIIRGSIDENEKMINDHVKNCFQHIYSEINFVHHSFIMTEKVKGGDLYGVFPNPEMTSTWSYFDFLFTNAFYSQDHSIQ